jgi:hypothetical protein
VRFWQKETSSFRKHSSYPNQNHLFFDDEGTENGGLIYGLSKDQNGHIIGNDVHLSSGQYMQDQIFTIDAGRNGQQKYSELTMQDRGDYSILEVFEAIDRISKVPRGQQASEWKKFRASHTGDHTRVVLSRSTDGASALPLKDAEGRDRIVLRVAPDGTPKLHMLNADGKVVSELPETSGSAPKGAQ